MFAVFGLRKTEISRFQSVSEQHIEKRDDGINLGEVGSNGSLFKNKRQ